MHGPARKEMKGRWMCHRKAMGWYNDLRQRFAELLED